MQRTLRERDMYILCNLIYRLSTSEYIRCTPSPMIIDEGKKTNDGGKHLSFFLFNDSFDFCMCMHISCILLHLHSSCLLTTMTVYSKASWRWE